MLHYIKGFITEQMPGMVCIENNGIGYEVYVPDGCIHVLPDSGEMVTLYTAMIVREDDVSLYGFPGKDYLFLFRLLMTVSGVGAKAALSILSVLTPPEVKQAIAFEDVNAICRANGVGKKIAQRVVLELKDKIQATDLPAGITPQQLAVKSDEKEEAVAALMALGFSRTEAMTNVLSISGENLSTEDYIKAALRQKK